ncbi:putative tubulin-specific chaperone [Aspergillus candidus]|uniref:Tubulin-specific chaperone n=1 Tax=Aspergillus candidus TaxID=41067 RepID=A0A2I2FPB3_ASPCN|nr:tubulin-specific chaperone [Aspergillus candidus]PLB42469.1 tubulin-specific chaperone [Aspergillus candidus]
MAEIHINQRLSYGGDLCTVRYIGKVDGTAGDWLGVEWDDATRGKHAGEHRGVRYFTCRSNQPTAGSFVRPSRPADKPRGFLEALRYKYALGFEEQERAREMRLSGDGGVAAAAKKPVMFNGKIAEEIGFDKIRKQLAELQELSIVLLDGLLVGGVLGNADGAGAEQRDAACKEIEQVCPKITELDLSRNLLVRWGEVADICARLKRLSVLKLSSNRFGPVEEGLRFEGIAELKVDDTLLSWDEIIGLTGQFPSLTSLSASANQIAEISTPISSSLRLLVLEGNEITSLASLKKLTSVTTLERLSLRENNLTTSHGANDSDNPIRFSPTLKSVDLSRNSINSWTFVNDLTNIFPGLEVLRISQNPLYDQPVGSQAVTGMPEKPMTVDEAYMLTLARLSKLQVLNYGTITAKDRSNAELYYLSLIGKELSATPEAAEPGILAAHPRYHELCETHGQPLVRRAEVDGLRAAVNPRSVAARLVRFAFRLAVSPEDDKRPGDQLTKLIEIPRSFDTYQTKAIVTRLFDLPPYEFKLVWETDELDPVSKEKVDDEDGWDSEDDTLDLKDVAEKVADDTRFVKREVELVDSTKDIGFWFPTDLVEAMVRVERVSRS